MQNHHADRFDDRGNFVRLWTIRADELYEAVLLVWNGKVIRTDLGDGKVDEVHLLYRPAQLLMGLCLEALLKGLIVEQNPNFIIGGRLPDMVKTHSLENLFNTAGIDLKDNEDELNFARKLSDAVEWVAKYPVPLKSGHLINPKHRSKNVLVRNDLDFERFKALRLRVRSELKDT